ncbi:kinase-like protein [Ceratobasidium sp. AG-I]|nr:kinase-like protein [Ceratobasidium sp. AG-I]
MIFQDHLGMVSMWMENGNLRDYIQENPSVNRYQLCGQVAAGVSYLHAINMVHGDIKALNILVSEDGVAQLSDFDHSILSGSTLAFSATTNLGGGTLRWMAPELLTSTEDGNNPLVVRNMQTDVYALGMTMLEVISGRIPYSEYAYDMGVYRAIDRKKPPIRPKELVAKSRQEDKIWALLLRCWNHNALARPTASYVLNSSPADEMLLNNSLKCQTVQVIEWMCRFLISGVKLYCCSLCILGFMYLYRLYY